MFSLIFPLAKPQIRHISISGLLFNITLSRCKVKPSWRYDVGDIVGKWRGIFLTLLLLWFAVNVEPFNSIVVSSSGNFDGEEEDITRRAVLDGVFNSQHNNLIPAVEVGCTSIMNPFKVDCR